MPNETYNTSAVFPAYVDPFPTVAPEVEIAPLGVLAIDKRLKERVVPNGSSGEDHLISDASKAISHLLALIRYTMNSDGQVPRCTDACRTYLRQHLDF